MNSLDFEFAPSFYVAGGTLQHDAPCYIARQADEELYEGLRQGHYCYVLTARQMGKSSLMVRTATRLQEADADLILAVLDLTGIGQNVTSEQWYGGLLFQLGLRLGLTEELHAYWQTFSELGPLQRWLSALREVVLRRASGRLVIFIDELDAVRSLPFATDEFFAGIRECYNLRATDPALARLSFCLLGVATPGDLIQDTRTTPFNIGRKIELHDFTATEASLLARGLNCAEPVAAALLNRILHWTNGHPYLTQRLCQAVAAANLQAAIPNPQSVDRLCAELFLSPGARQSDNNLLLVRERLLRSEADVASLLTLYGQVRAGQHVADDETNPLVSVLRLAGVVRSAAGRLGVRNRIYAAVFDQAWVADNLPEAEVRRQRAAYRRGVWRASAAASFVLLLLAALAGIAWQQRNRAQAQQEANRRLLYAAEMNVVAQAWEAANVGRVRELLDHHRPLQGQTDLRGFEWYYYDRVSRQTPPPLRHAGFVYGVAFAPDGQRLATAVDDGTLKLWETASGRELLTLRGHTDKAWGVAYSPDGRWLASAAWDRTVRLWEAATGAPGRVFDEHRAKVLCVAFSLDGRWLASGDGDGVLFVREAATGRVKFQSATPGGWIAALAFAPDGRLAAVSESGKAKVWDAASGRLLLDLQLEPDLSALAFAPDGRTLATGCWHSAEAKLWDSRTGRLRQVFKGHAGAIWSVAFSPDGRWLATSGDDSVAKLWDVATGQEAVTFKGHELYVFAVAFAPDGKRLATASGDRTARFWRVPEAQEPDLLKGHQGWLRSLAFTPDGKTLVTGADDKTVRLWDTVSGRALRTLSGHTGRVYAVACSPDGKLIASGGADTTIKLWDAASGREVRTLRGHSGWLQSLAFAPDGQRLASGAFGENGKVWDVASGRVLYTLDSFAHYVWALSFSPDGRWLAAGGDDNVVALLDAATGREVRRFATQVSAGRVLAFAPDGRTLAVEHGGISAGLWDVTSGRELQRLKGHTARIFALAFTPDGRRLATGGADGQVKLWETATGQELTTLRAHGGKIFAVAFAPDGQTLASAGLDRTVRLWRIAAAEPAF